MTFCWWMIYLNIDASGCALPPSGHLNNYFDTPLHIGSHFRQDRQMQSLHNFRSLIVEVVTHLLHAQERRVIFRSPAEMWSCRAKNGALVCATVGRSTRSQSTLKSQYDALVIGGGGFCSKSIITAKVENINFYNVLFCFLAMYLCNVTCQNKVHSNSNHLWFYLYFFQTITL